jgi:acyl carrier protein
MSDDVADKIIAIIAEQAMLEPSEVTLDSSPEALGLDSLGMVEIVFAIEETFDISVPFNANEPDRLGFRHLLSRQDRRRGEDAHRRAELRPCAASSSPASGSCRPWAWAARRISKGCARAGSASARSHPGSRPALGQDRRADRRLQPRRAFHQVAALPLRPHHAVRPDRGEGGDGGGRAGDRRGAVAARRRHHRRRAERDGDVDSNYRAVFEEGKNRVHPFIVPRLMTSAASSHISMAYGLRGPVLDGDDRLRLLEPRHGQRGAGDPRGRRRCVVSGGAEAPLVSG